MADLAEDPLAPDWGQIDNGDARAVSDALFLIWQLIQPKPVSPDADTDPTPQWVEFIGGGV